MTFVRHAITGEKLVCCWDDCEQYGHDEHQEVETENGRTLTYIFCHDRHRAYWAHAHRSQGNLPTGSRRLI